MKKFKPEIGALVVVSHEPGATMYRIKAIEGFRVGVIDAALKVRNQAPSWHDVSIFMSPSIGQINAFTGVQS